MVAELKGHSLKKLITDAKKIVLFHGQKRVSQRGTTCSLFGVKLTWVRPLEDSSSYFYWDKKSDDWYQKVFVDARKENKPEVFPDEGQILFPYTYAHRSRFYDGGLGYLLSAVKATQRYGKSLNLILKSEENFYEYLSFAAEFVHLQNLLACLSWVGRNFFKKYLEDTKILESFLNLTRQDSLVRLCQEAKRQPESRRLVTPSFVYSKIDQGLDGVLGIPPYQFFQVLPARSLERLSSLHFHRSLDAGGGVQLDFHHDLNWLKFLSQKTGRKVGSITIMAGDFHVYLPRERNSEHLTKKTNIVDWLESVTDGYEAGRGLSGKLLKEKEFYSRNARRVYQSLVK